MSIRDTFLAKMRAYMPVQWHENSTLDTLVQSIGAALEETLKEVEINKITPEELDAKFGPKKCLCIGAPSRTCPVHGDE